MGEREREREQLRVCLHQEELQGEREAEGARSYKDCGGISKGKKEHKHRTINRSLNHIFIKAIPFVSGLIN